MEVQNMKKRISLLLVIALALLLTACQKDRLDPANPVTLTMQNILFVADPE